MSAPDRIRASVVGATGYTGAELLRLLLGHPRVDVTFVGGHAKAGEPIARVLPSLRGILDGLVEAFDAGAVAARADVAFCALPHGASAPIVQALRERSVVTLDLSADFRLRDADAYRTWYGEHGAGALFGHAVYGLPELHREELRTADLVAVPGCYPTASTLAVAPLLASDLVSPDGIVIDAKSGVSGAGRSPSAGTHFTETSEGVRAYKIAGAHRHTPEIEQELSAIARRPVRVTFTPHLVPMSRGILATAYAHAKSDAVDAARCTEAARALYAGSPSVVVLEPGACPDTLWVRGSNRAHVAYSVDARTRLVVAQCTLDNLVKGAAGQAVQCMNLRFGRDEGEGLEGAAMFP